MYCSAGADSPALYQAGLPVSSYTESQEICLGRLGFSALAILEFTLRDSSDVVPLGIPGQTCLYADLLLWKNAHDTGDVGLADSPLVLQGPRSLPQSKGKEQARMGRVSCLSANELVYVFVRFQAPAHSSK